MLFTFIMRSLQDIDSMMQQGVEQKAARGLRLVCDLDKAGIAAASRILSVVLQKPDPKLTRP